MLYKLISLYNTRMDVNIVVNSDFTIPIKDVNELQYAPSLYSPKS